MYGYFGAAMGFPEVELLFMGGAVQLLTSFKQRGEAKDFFDDPKDAEMVKLGIEYYKKQHGESLSDSVLDDLKNQSDISPRKTDILTNVAEDVAESCRRNIEKIWHDLQERLSELLKL